MALRLPARLWPLTLLSACGPATWSVTIWGEDFIEREIPASAFDDDCSVAFDTFTVALDGATLLDGNGTAAGDALSGVFDLTEPGPQEVGTVVVPAGTYDTVRFVLASDTDATLHTAGSLTCGDTAVTFDWSFPPTTTYDCEPAPLTPGKGTAAETELTIHGDHLFYDALEDPDALLRGRPILEADADADGQVTLAELARVTVAPLGHRVGRYSEVTDLAAFVTHLTQTVGHVDGEGHCTVTF